MEGIDIVKMKEQIIQAGIKSVQELIKVAEKEIVIEDGVEDDDLTADKLTRAAQAKKIAIMDSFEILAKIEQEQASLEASRGDKSTPPTSFAERLAKKNK